MNFILKTTTKATSKESVLNSFDREFFIRLAPPFPKLKLLRYDGCETGNEVHLELNMFIYKQKWISLITDHGSTEKELHFIDEGTIIPAPLKYWKHLHIIREVENGVEIEDNVTYKTGFKLLDILLVPFFYIVFLYRKPIYKRQFKGGGKE